MNLFISNLGLQVNDESLRAVFATYGEVRSARVIRDLSDGQTKPYGFVDMPVARDAEKAIRHLHGAVINGGLVSVSRLGLGLLQKHHLEI